MKISQLTPMTGLQMGAVIPVSVAGRNFTVTLGQIARQLPSAVAMFHSVQDCAEATVVPGQGATGLPIVYDLSRRSFYAMLQAYGQVTYYSQWEGRENYIGDQGMRPDCIFATPQGKAYIWVGDDLVTITPSVSEDRDQAIAEINTAKDEALARLLGQKITPDMLSQSVLDIINSSGGGSVTNLADDEDIASVGGLLKLKDRAYSPETFSGKGFKILRKNVEDGQNILRPAMVAEANTVYVVKYDYVVNNIHVKLGAGSVLLFEGGSVSGGTQQYIEATDDCKILGGRLGCRIRVIGKNVTIDGCDIDYSQNCIRVEASKDASGLVIRNCRFRSITTAASSDTNGHVFGGMCVKFVNDSGSAIPEGVVTRGVTIQNNVFEFNTMGIECAYNNLADVLISGNTFNYDSTNGRNGMGVSLPRNGSESVLVTGNKFNGCVTGVELGVGTVAVTANLFDGCTRAIWGSNAGDYRLLFDGNNVNGGGIEITGANGASPRSDVTITANRISGLLTLRYIDGLRLIGNDIATTAYVDLLGTEHIVIADNVFHLGVEKTAFGATAATGVICRNLSDGNALYDITKIANARCWHNDRTDVSVINEWRTFQGVKNTDVPINAYGHPVVLTHYWQNVTADPLLTIKMPNGGFKDVTIQFTYHKIASNGNPLVATGTLVIDGYSAAKATLDTASQNVSITRTLTDGTVTVTLKFNRGTTSDNAHFRAFVWQSSASNGTTYNFGLATTSTEWS